jgi:hypothetical protein
MISPELLDKKTGISSYNLALSHSDFADNFIHLYWYLKYNKAPRYLLLYVTPESMDKRFNTFNSYRFSQITSDPVVRQVVQENDPDYLRWDFIPFLRFAYYNKNVLFAVIQGWKHYLVKKSAAYYPDGFEPPTKRVWGNHSDDFIELYEKDVAFKWDLRREKYLLKCINLAQKHNIKIYLYESPVLQEALIFQKNRKEIIKRIQDLADKENVPFIQFQNLPMAKEKKYFISALNFNMDGVKVFNDSLADFLKRKVITR